jgi:hypothetical protein
MKEPTPSDSCGSVEFGGRPSDVEPSSPQPTRHRPSTMASKGDSRGAFTTDSQDVSALRTPWLGVDEEWLSVQQAADACGVTYRTIYRMVC